MSDPFADLVPAPGGAAKGPPPDPFADLVPAAAPKPPAAATQPPVSATPPVPPSHDPMGANFDGAGLEEMQGPRVREIPASVPLDPPANDLSWGAEKFRNAAQGAVESVGAVPQGAMVMSKGALRGQLAMFDRIDRGEDLRGEFPWQPLVAAYAKTKDPAARAKMRERLTKAAAIDPRDTDWYKAGERVTQAGERAFPLTEEQKKGFVNEVARGTGSMVPLVGTGALGAITRAPAIATAGMAAIGVGGGASGQFKEAINKGASLEQALSAGSAGAAVGMTEFVPVARLLDRVDKISGGRIKAMIVQAAVNGTEEAIQETAQNILNNLAAQGIYDPTRDTFAGTGDDAAVGGAAGVLIGFLTGAITGGRRAAPAQPQPQNQPAVAPATQPTAPPQVEPAPPPAPPTDVAPAPVPTGQPAAISGEPPAAQSDQPPPAIDTRGKSLKDERNINDARPIGEIDAADRQSLIGMAQAMIDATPELAGIAQQIAAADTDSLAEVITSLRGLMANVPLDPALDYRPGTALFEALPDQESKLFISQAALQLETRGLAINHPVFLALIEGQAGTRDIAQLTPEEQERVAYAIEIYLPAIENAAQPPVAQGDITSGSSVAPPAAPTQQPQTAPEPPAITGPMMAAADPAYPDVALQLLPKARSIEEAHQVLRDFTDRGLRKMAESAGIAIPDGADRDQIVEALIGRQAQQLPLAPKEPPPPAQERELADQIVQVDPSQIQVDAKRFQFKTTDDPQGVTGKLAAVEGWDAIRAGITLLWEARDGTLYVADGHQRTNLAKRLQANGDTGIRLNAIIRREVDGFTAEHVRAIAAAKNVAENYDNAVDIARVFREGFGDYLENLPRTVALNNGRELAKLSDDAFMMVVNEIVQDNHAAHVGRLISDPAQQMAALTVLAKTQPANEQQARLIVEQVREAGFDTATQTTLFGDEQIASSLMAEKARIVDQAKKLLRQDRALFRKLVDQQDAIAAAGNVLDTDSNTARLNDDERLFALIERLAFRTGPVASALTDAARLYKSGGTIGKAVRDFLNAVRANGTSELGGGQPNGGAQPAVEGEGRGGDAPIAGDQAGDTAGLTPPADEGPGLFAAKMSRARQARLQQPSEAGQAVIPGAERISQKEAIEREMNRPLAPDARQKPADDGLFGDGHKQDDLFGSKVLPSTKLPAVPGQRGAMVLTKQDKAARASVFGGAAGQRVRTGAVSAPATTERAQPPKISSMLREVRTVLDVPVRLGRMPQRWNTLGWYRPSSGVVRNRVPNEINVFAHEVGHGLHYKHKAALDIIIGRYRALVETWAYPGADPKSLDKEGLAEFFRWYITNPEFARAQSAAFYRDFDTWLKVTEPKAWRTLQGVQAEYQTYLTQPSGQAVLSDIRFGNPGPLANASETFKEIAETARRDGPFLALKDAKDDATAYMNERALAAYTAAVDDLWPVAIAVERLMKLAKAKFGAESVWIKAANDAYKLARLTRGNARLAEMDIMQGVVAYRETEPQGPSLRGAVEKANGNKWSTKARETTRDFSAYLVSRRAIVLWDRFRAGKLAQPPTKATIADHQQNIRELEAKHPTFQEAALMVYDWRNALLKKKRDAGLISQETYAAIMEESLDYVPFIRDRDDVPQVYEAAGLRGASMIKRIRGSQREIVDPLETLMRDAYQTERMIANNDVKRQLLKLAEAVGRGGGAIAERIPHEEQRIQQVRWDGVLDQLQNRIDSVHLTKGDRINLEIAIAQMGGLEIDPLLVNRKVPAEQRGEPIIVFHEKGEPVYVRLGSDDDGLGLKLYEALSDIGGDNSDGIIDFVAGFTQAWRAGTTTFSLPFSIANIMRDQIDVWAKSDAGYKPFVDGLIGLVGAAKNNKYRKMWEISGGAMGTQNFGHMNSVEVAKQIEDLNRKGISVRRVANPRRAINMLATVSDYSEMATRVGLFRKAYLKAKKEGLSDYAAMIEAGYQARDVMDFARRGGKFDAVRRMVGFLNAFMQAEDKNLRIQTGLFAVVAKSLRGEKLNTNEKKRLALGYKMFVRMAMMGLLGLAISALYADDDEYEEMRELRVSHWVFKLPDGKWWAQPKPFATAVFSTVAEHAFDGWAKENPLAASNFLEDLIKLYSPPGTIPIYTTYQEIKNNRRQFDNRPIIPERQENLEPALQYGPYTSALAKAVGKAIGVAPYQVDHVIGGLGSTVGRDLARIFDETDPNAPSIGLDDAYVIRRFVRDPNRNTESSKEFWDQVGRHGGDMTVAKSTFKWLKEKAKSPNATEADQRAPWEYLETITPQRRVYALLNERKLFDDDSHPLVRARRAGGVIANVRQRIRDDKGMSPDDKRLADDILTQRAAIEYRNALVAIGHEGWKQRKAVSLAENFQKLQDTVPAAAKLLKDSFSKVDLDDQRTVRGYPNLVMRMEARFQADRARAYERLGQPQ